MKKLLILFLVAVFITACSNNPEPQEAEESKTEEMKEEMAAAPAVGTIMLIVRIKTNLTEEEMVRRAREREPEFEALPGLIQKYYIKLGPEGEFGGVYIWDSMESLQAYRESDLAATIAQAYEATEPPSVEKIDILFQLRD